MVFFSPVSALVIARAVTEIINKSTVLQNIAAVIFFYLFSWIFRAIYRIYFHPLSRYPGSAIAAVSKPWYEWYQNFHRPGLLIFEFERLHALHGPIIRIAPNELHISDPSIYLDITKVGSHFIKDPTFYKFMALPSTVIGEIDPSKHRTRRLVLSPAFSPSRILALSPMILQKTNQLLARYEEISERGEAINIFSSSKAFTMDIISQIVLGKSLKCIEDPEFRNYFNDYLHKTLNAGWVGTTFPILAGLGMALPEWFLVEDYLQHRKLPADSTRRGESIDGLDRSIVIDALVDPTAAKDHSILNREQLADEAIMLLTAGNDTTSNAMIIGIYEILKDGKIYEKLRNELMGSFPDVGEGILYEKAIKLPYLASTAVIKEVLRYSNPVPGRAPRVVPPEGYTLYGHKLASGTILTTSSYILNRQSSIWTNPKEFSPERWLQSDSNNLDKYMTSFYRGTRGCLGKEYMFPSQFRTSYQMIDTELMKV
ncbi:cytochrome P450 [Tricladium varicosporioides]|nr:cytochrome P450 [Hymenoscyphus varicosporioides]